MTLCLPTKYVVEQELIDGMQKYNTIACTFSKPLSWSPWSQPWSYSIIINGKDPHSMHHFTSTSQDDQETYLHHRHSNHFLLLYFVWGVSIFIYNVFQLDQNYFMHMGMDLPSHTLIISFLSMFLILCNHLSNLHFRWTW